MGSPKKAPNAIARSTAKGTAAQNGERAIPYSAVDVSRPTVYAPTAKKATKPRSRRPARPRVMLRPRPMRTYRATTATTWAKNGPLPRRRQGGHARPQADPAHGDPAPDDRDHGDDGARHGEPVRGEQEPAQLAPERAFQPPWPQQA